MSPSDPPPSTSESLSDISEFAAWEALHPSQARGEGERERSLADMQRPERMRIWGDRDSSNDVRSSDEELDETGKRLSVENYEGQREEREIPNSDVEREEEQEQDDDNEPPSSQPKPESASEGEDEHAVEDSSQEKVQHKTVIEISSDESEDSESEAEEEIEVGGEQDNGSEAEEDAEDEQDEEVEAESSVEDEFEGFDVNPEDKEFFNKLLDIAPPEAVMEFIGKSRLITPQPLSTTTSGAQGAKRAKIFAEVQTLSDIAPDVQRAKRVKIFAEDHPVREQIRWTEDELQEYKDDIHGFAKAAGFSDLHADLEVGKAMGAWKIERGISLLLPNETAPLGATSGGGESAQEAKKRRKAEKKARRKLNKREKESSHYSSAVPESTIQSSSIPLTLKQPKLQSSKSYYGKEAPVPSAPKKLSRSNMSLSTEDEKSVGLALKAKRMKKVEKKKLRKKARLGPKKSEYFSSNTRDDPAPHTKPKDVDVPKGQRDHGEKRKPPKESKKLLVKTAHEPKKAVKKAPILAKEVSTEQENQKVATKNPTEPELVEKKKKNRKRKRKRNKNRLPEEPSDEKENLAGVAIQTEGEMSNLPPKQKVRDISQKLNSADASEKVRKSNLAPSKHSIVEYEGSGDPSNIQQTFSQLNSGAGHGTGRLSKCRDRGRGRKPKSNEKNLERPDTGELAVGETTIPASDYLIESIETNEPLPSSKKKRKRNKSKNRDENVESSEVGEAAAVEPLAELADTNSKKEGRLGHAKKRTRSADATDIASRSSNQSSKVHHSQ